MLQNWIEQQAFTTSDPKLTLFKQGLGPIATKAEEMPSSSLP